MEPVTHIPHQHIKKFRPTYDPENTFTIIETINPENGRIDYYLPTTDFTIDDKGIYGSFVKI